jgi:hypothetical protein
MHEDEPSGSKSRIAAVALTDYNERAEQHPAADVPLLQQLTAGAIVRAVALTDPDLFVSEFAALPYGAREKLLRRLVEAPDKRPKVVESGARFAERKFYKMTREDVILFSVEEEREEHACDALSIARVRVGDLPSEMADCFIHVFNEEYKNDVEYDPLFVPRKHTNSTLAQHTVELGTSDEGYNNVRTIARRCTSGGGPYHDAGECASADEILDYFLEWLAQEAWDAAAIASAQALPNKPGDESAWERRPKLHVRVNNW